MESWDEAVKYGERAVNLEPQNATLSSVAGPRVRTQGGRFESAARRRSGKEGEDRIRARSTTRSRERSCAGRPGAVLHRSPRVHGRRTGQGARASCPSAALGFGDGPPDPGSCGGQGKALPRRRKGVQGCDSAGQQSCRHVVAAGGFLSPARTSRRYAECGTVGDGAASQTGPVIFRCRQRTAFWAAATLLRRSITCRSICRRANWWNPHRHSGRTISWASSRRRWGTTEQRHRNIRPRWHWPLVSLPARKALSRVQ